MILQPGSVGGRRQRSALPLMFLAVGFLRFPPCGGYPEEAQERAIMSLDSLPVEDRPTSISAEISTLIVRALHEYGADRPRRIPRLGVTPSTPCWETR